MSEQDSNIAPLTWKDAKTRTNRDLRTFLEAYDLRHYAHEMQRLIEMGLPTIASGVSGRSSGVEQSSARDAAIVEQIAEQIAGEIAGVEIRRERGAPQIPAGVAAPTGLPRVQTFVDREHELTLLTATLRSGSSVGVIAIQGMGGVGKTALAAEASPDWPRIATPSPVGQCGLQWKALQC